MAAVLDRVRHGLRVLQPRTWFLAALLTVVLTAAAVPLLNVALYSPARTVAAYLNALSSGDAGRALSLLQAPEPEVTAALSEEVLDNAPAVPQAVRIVGTRQEGDRTLVDARFDLGTATHHSTFTVQSLRPAAGLFDRWAIAVADWPRLDLQISGSSVTTVDRVPVPADRGPVPVFFPVLYDVGFDARYLRSPTQRVEVLDAGKSYAVALAPKPTEELTAEVARQMKSHLDECVKSRTLLPTGCTLGYETDHEILGDVRWSLEEYPTVRLEAVAEGLMMQPARVVVRVQGRSRDIVTAHVSDFDERLRFSVATQVVVEGDSVRIEPRAASGIGLADTD